MVEPKQVLDFWLGEVGPDGWYAGGAALDATCRARFADLCALAREGGLESWADGPTGTLAYLIVTDQLSRNIHRDTALAFATDPLALAAARRALAEGWDLQVPEPERQFFYMPFEHSEDTGDQALAVACLTDRLPGHPDLALHARAHQAIIAQFGRFPNRNAALDRRSTPQEAVFLAEGGYGAVVRRLRQSHAPGA